MKDNDLDPELKPIKFGKHWISTPTCVTLLLQCLYLTFLFDPPQQIILTSHIQIQIPMASVSFIYSFISTFDFFFKLVAFCTEFNLFTPICFVLVMIMDLPYICDHQVGYSAGGYSLSPRWFLTLYIYPFFQD